MPDDPLTRLRECHTDALPPRRSHLRMRVDDGRQPATLLIGRSDSRPVPCLAAGRGRCPQAHHDRAEHRLVPAYGDVAQACRIAGTRRPRAWSVD